MPLSETRILEITQRFLARPGSRPAHLPTDRELQRLRLWVTIYLSTPAQQGRLGSFLRRRGGRGGRRRRQLRAYLAAHHAEMHKYKDATDLEAARSSIPAELFHRRELASDIGFDPQPPDHLAHSLVTWFKDGFMSWIDPVRCTVCGGDTDIVGSADETALLEEERRGGAGRCELWRCTTDTTHPLVRFPRYSLMSKLLGTRTGRCGEFSGLFNLFLWAAGLEARVVHDDADHVWNEYYSEAAGRWIHLDSCERAYDTPLVYSLGWGKKVGYVLAFGQDGVQDVSRGYMADYNEEIELFNRQIRQSLPVERQMMLANRDRRHDIWLADDAGRMDRARNARAEEQGRQSGTLQWRQMRHELGTREAHSQEPRPIKPTSLTYSLWIDPTALILAGTADFEDGHIRLTSDGPSQTSSMFVKVALQNTSSFVVQVSFRISKTNAEAGGADGMAFVCMRSIPGDAAETRALLGEGGAGLGYDGLGTEGDFAVEIDTYQTSHHRYSKACTQPQAIPNVTDGKTRTLIIHHDSQSRKVKAWLSLHADDGDEEIFLWDADLPRCDGEKDNEGERLYWMGVTASCGGLFEDHDVLEFEVWQPADAKVDMKDS